MSKRFLHWLVPFVIGAGMFGFTTSVHATMVVDETISDVFISNISSTDSGATGVNFSVTFTVDAVPDEPVYGVSIWNQPTSCSLQDWQDCYVSFTSASISGIDATLDTEENNPGHASLQALDTFVSGTYTVDFFDVAMPNFNGATRFFVRNQNHEQNVDVNVGVGTQSEPMIIGAPLVVGTVTDPDGNPMSTWLEVYREDWSIQQGGNSDDFGFFAIENPGFESGETIHLSAHPDSSTGLFTTSDEFVWNGSTVSLDIELIPASKTISGTVTYRDNESAALNAQVNANRPGSWAGVDVDADGNYSFTMSGGEYEVCVNGQWDQETGRQKTRDWYTKQNEQCKHIAFADDSSEESETLNFVVDRADASIEGVFTNPDGSFPSNGGWVSFWKDDLWFGGNVSESDGSFSIAVVGGNATQAVTTLRARAVGSTIYQAQYNPNNQDERTYWDTSTVTVNAGQALDLGTIVLSERDVTVNVSVVDEDGNAVSDVYVDAWQDKGGWSNTQADDNGVATLYLYAGKWNIRPNLWNTTNYVFTEKETQLEVSSGDTESLEFVVQNTTVTVSANAYDEDGILVNIQGWVNCWSDNGGGGGGFGGQLQNGTGNFGAVGGEYRCNLWVNDSNYQANGEQQVTFVDGENVVLDFTLRQANATVVVNVKDTDNKKVNAENARVYLQSPESGWRDARLDNGQATLRVASGNYRLGVWFDTQFGQSSEYIFGWGAEKDVTVEDNDSLTKTLTVQKVSGSVTAELEDADGNPVQNAWVGCGNWRELEGKPLGDFEGGKIIESGSQSGADGVAVVGLVVGHEYDCWVGVQSDFSDLIGPESQIVMLTKKEPNVSLTFVFQESTARIKGDVDFAPSSGLTADDISNLWCNGWAEEGFSTWDDSFDDTFTLKAVPGTWHIWCGTEIVNDDGERIHYDPQEEVIVNLKKDDTVNKHIRLRESVFKEVPQAVTETWDSTTAKTIQLSDGTQVQIPANALAQSGNVTMTAEPETQAKRTFTDSPFGYPWDFTVYDSTGATIDSDFSQAVTLVIPYDEEILQELDITESNLLPKVWDDSLGAWTSVDNASQDEEANTLSFTVSHFSQVGITYNNRLASVSKPKRPRALTVSDITSSKARFAWNKPKSSVVTKYRIQLRKFHSNKEKQWRKVGGITKRHKVLKNLNDETRYQFRVRACNAVGCGKWADWKEFTTL